MQSLPVNFMTTSMTAIIVYTVCTFLLMIFGWLTLFKDNI